jgi:2-polyprenyl-6-methoxyphenol hydroxylase-like FAD-dependent oxidoreductase
MDVLWFRLSRSEVDPVGGFGRFSRGCLIVLIDRGSYFQVGFVIRKGSYARLREQGIEAFRERLGTQLPFLADRVAELGSFDDVRLLDVQLGRLRRWATDGLLLIGDAAHAMSPVGGVGINLAIQDAVATARLLAPALQAGTVSRSDLRAVQRRRWLPTVLTQTAQQVAHRLVVARAVEEQPEPRPAARRPLLIAVLDRLPALRAVPAYFVSIGVRPEEPPPAAVRRNASSEARPV